MPLQEKENHAAYLQTAPLAAKLGVSVRTLERWRKDGVIPFKKISKRVILYRWVDVLGALKIYEVPTHEKTAGVV